MNGEYIKAMDMDAYMEHALPVVKEVVTKDYDLKKIAELLKTRIEVFPDIKEKIDFFEELPEYDVAMYTHKISQLMRLRKYAKPISQKKS